MRLRKIEPTTMCSSNVFTRAIFSVNVNLKKKKNDETVRYYY